MYFVLTMFFVLRLQTPITKNHESFFCNIILLCSRFYIFLYVIASAYDSATGYLVVQHMQTIDIFKFSTICCDLKCDAVLRYPHNMIYKTFAVYRKYSYFSCCVCMFNSPLPTHALPSLLPLLLNTHCCCICNELR